MDGYITIVYSRQWRSEGAEGADRAPSDNPRGDKNGVDNGKNGE